MPTHSPSMLNHYKHIISHLKDQFPLLTMGLQKLTSFFIENQITVNHFANHKFVF